jgi:hypothetical protein
MPFAIAPHRHQARTGSARRLRLALCVGGALAALCVALSGCAISFGQAQQIKPGSGITVPVHVYQTDGATRIEADITIKGRGPFRFVLDTGAESSAIDSSLAAQLGLQPDGDPHPVGGIGGTTEATPVAIDNWSLDTLRLPAGSIDSAALSAGLGASEEGLLGADILSEFGTITIDFVNGQLTVYKQIA